MNNTERDRYLDDTRNLVDHLEQLHPDTFTADIAHELREEINDVTVSLRD